jgi:hypothetical protein
MATKAVVSALLTAGQQQCGQPSLGLTPAYAAGKQCIVITPY